MSIYMIRSKSRGHQRKFKRLLRWMDKIDPFKNANDLPFKDTEDSYEHFHVPCGPWLSKPKTSGKIKTAFCKVVAAITYPDVRESQIIIFYDEEYYNSFWDRKGPYQIWTRVDDKRSFAKERGIMTKLPEIGYIEELNDEDYYTKSNIWFYGEWI